jgi:hypothetical protein
MLMEVFHNVDQYDAKSMYPSVCKLIKFPIYEPVGFGYQRITASKLLENLEEYDWFTLTVSFEFPKDSPTIKRQFIQHQNGKTHCYRKVNHQILRPPELELIVDEYPDIEIKVHKGWIWDRTELEDLIEKGKLSGKPDDYYLDLSELFGTLMNERKKHKKDGNDLLQNAIKLLMNVGSYGKFAQCKEVPDSEALEETILNDGDFSSIANNAVSESVVTHPEFANAITACARCLNGLIAKEHDAKLSVTDSVLTANNTPINLNKCKKGFKWLDKLVEGSKYENETDDNTYLAIICGKRGKTLIPQNEELVELLKNLDNQEKLDRAKSIVTDLAQQMEEKIIKVPKFAKDGIKYEGNQARQWEQCSHDCLDRLYGKTLKKTIKHLLKRNEVLKGQTHYKMVNMAIHKPRVLDCVDFGSYPYEDYEQHVQMENTKQKLKGADRPKTDGKGNVKEEGKPYSTAGQAYRFHNEEFWARFEKAKPRSLPSQKYNADDIRLFVIFADLGLLADSEIAKQLGCSRQAIANQRKKLTAGQTYHYWFQKQLADLVNLKGVRDICQNCKVDAVTALQRSSVWEDMDDMTRKKADKILNGLMTRLENRYGVRLVRKSKRAKKLKMEKVA